MIHGTSAPYIFEAYNTSFYRHTHECSTLDCIPGISKLLEQSVLKFQMEWGTEFVPATAPRIEISIKPIFKTEICIRDSLP